MFHFTLLATAIMSSMFLVQSQNSDICQSFLEEYTICLLNAPDNSVNGDDYYIDESACTECFTNNDFFEQYNADNCNDATTEICTFFNVCLQECVPKSTVCSEEITAYYTCAFASTYAPESCAVTCDGMVGGGASGSDDSPIDSGDGDKDEDKDVDEQKDATSAGSTTSTVKALLLSGSILFVAAGLLL
jgi:hypothetical protein